MGKGVFQTLFILLIGFISCIAYAEIDSPHGAVLFTNEQYDYAPSIIREGSVQDIWWCGYGTTPGTTFKSDVIYHRSYNFDTKLWSSISTVLWPTAQSWDSRHTCDPSVIMGRFFNPENGSVYSYAMYYTATDDLNGRNNRIGVAFSNNGKDWIKYSQPIIYPTNSPTDSYGAGQAATYNGDGLSSIRIFYTDTTTPTGSRTITAAATDGINFTQPVITTNSSDSGLLLFTGNDYAFDYSTGYFYGVLEIKPFRATDRESYQLGLFRIRSTDLKNGIGSWETLSLINSDNTGFDLNHNPGLLRDKYGNLTLWLPQIAVYFGAGANNPATWDLSAVVWRPNPKFIPLDSYVSSICGEGGHDTRVTAGTAASACQYKLQSSFGFVSMKPVYNSRPLYSCRAGQNHFLSLNSGCENQYPLGITGWIFTIPVDNSQALYRCKMSTHLNHFVSRSTSCDGHVYEGLLGYTLN